MPRQHVANAKVYGEYILNVLMEFNVVELKCIESGRGCICLSVFSNGLVYPGTIKVSVCKIAVSTVHA